LDKHAHALLYIYMEWEKLRWGEKVRKWESEKERKKERKEGERERKEKEKEKEKERREREKEEEKEERERKYRAKIQRYLSLLQRLLVCPSINKVRGSEVKLLYINLDKLMGFILIFYLFWLIYYSIYFHLLSSYIYFI